MRLAIGRFLLAVLMIGALAGVFYDVKTTRAQNNGTVNTGQQSVTGTAAAVSGPGAGTICIKALAGNSINVYVGNSGVTTSTGMELAAGNAYCAPTANANNFYVVASTTGASVSWIVSN